MRTMSGFLQQTTSTISNQNDQPRNSKIILDELMSIVKECQIKYGGKTELATEQDMKIVRLCLVWERTLNHGIKHQSSFVQNVTDLISGTTDQPNFWTFAYQHLTKHEKERFSTFRHIWTDRGKIMALLRAALNERALQRYVLVWLNDVNLKKYYEDWALMRDDEATNLLPSIAGGLDSILFAVTVDCPELNVCTVVTDSRTEPIISTPHPAEPSTSSSSSLRTAKSTKRKIISFDNDNDDEAISACGSMPKSLSSMCLKFSDNQSTNPNGYLPGNDPNELYPNAATSSLSSKNNLLNEDIYVGAPESPSLIQMIPPQQQMSTSSLHDLIAKHNFDSFHDFMMAKSQSDSGLNEETFGSSTVNTSSSVQSSSKRSSMHSSMESVKSLQQDDSAELKIRLQESLDRCSMLENRVAELSLENHRLRGLANPSSRYGFNYFSVSVPRVLLQRNQRKKYYAYEVHIIPTHGGDEWTLLRRYSEFYKLHKHFQKDNVAIKTLDFPPKKKFGNMDAHFVEQRRQRLQVYLRHLLALLPDVSRCQTRSHLEQCFPFFK